MRAESEPRQPSVRCCAWQVLRSRWAKLIKDARCVASAKAKAAALRARAAVAAAPFSAAALVARAEADADWAAILQALRQRRSEAKAARVAVSRVAETQPEAALRAATLLQAGWRGRAGREQVQLLRDAQRRAELVRALHAAKKYRNVLATDELLRTKIEILLWSSIHGRYSTWCTRHRAAPAWRFGVYDSSVSQASRHWPSFRPSPRVTSHCRLIGQHTRANNVHQH